MTACTCNFLTGTSDDITLEDLVDDFVTFYFAGKLYARIGMNDMMCMYLDLRCPLN